MSDTTIDVDIRYGTGDWAEQDIWPLSQSHATLVCNPKDAALLQRDPSRLNDADIVPIIGSENDWPAMFQKLGLDTPPPGPWMLVDSSLLALETIARGRGIVIVNQMFSKAHDERGNLVEPLRQALNPQNNFYTVAQPSPKKRQQITLFHDWLRTITGQVPRI